MCDLYIIPDIVTESEVPKTFYSDLNFLTYNNKGSFSKEKKSHRCGN